MSASSQKHCRHCGRWVGNPRQWCKTEPCSAFQDAADAMVERWRQGTPNGWDLFLARKYGGDRWASSPT